MLIHIKAVKHMETEPNDIDLSFDLMEEEAEWIVSPENEKNTEKQENQQSKNNVQGVITKVHIKVMCFFDLISAYLNTDCLLPDSKCQQVYPIFSSVHGDMDVNN